MLNYCSTHLKIIILEQGQGILNTALATLLLIALFVCKCNHVVVCVINVHNVCIINV